MGLPMGQKLVKSGSTWARPCGTHIFETSGWIYTIQSSMELSRPSVLASRPPARQIGGQTCKWAGKTRQPSLGKLGEIPQAELP